MQIVILIGNRKANNVKITQRTLRFERQQWGFPRLVPSPFRRCRQKNPLAHRIWPLIDHAVHSLETQVGHAHEIDIGIGQRTADTGLAGFFDNRPVLCLQTLVKNLTCFLEHDNCVAPGRRLELDNDHERQHFRHYTVFALAGHLAITLVLEPPATRPGWHDRALWLTLVHTKGKIINTLLGPEHFSFYQV